MSYGGIGERPYFRRIMKTRIAVAAGTILLVFAMNGMAQHKQKLTVETIFGGSLYEPAPSEMRWAPDGRRVAYFLPEGSDGRALWVLDAPTGKKTRVLSPDQVREMAPSSEDASISERERARRNRYDTPSYSWAPDADRILLTSAGRLHVYTLSSGSAVLLAPSKTGLLDAKFSPDGKWVSFIDRHDIWAVPSSGGKEKQLTFGGNELLLHGEPDWIYEEEFDLHTCYEWAPDSRHIAFLELDESVVPVYPIVDQLRSQASVEMQRYPKSGDPNPKVRAGAVNLDSSQVTWGDRTAEYIPRIGWADSNSFVMQLLSRTQNELELLEVNAQNGSSRRIISEQDPNWVDIGGDLRFLSGGSRFLWTSDRTGFRHIFLYDRNGQLVRQITTGDWVVYEIAGIDEPGGWIYYMSNQTSTIGRNLFRIRMDGSNPERITNAPGSHRITMNTQATGYVDSFSSMTRRQEIEVRDLGARRETGLFHARALDEFDLVAPEMSELKTPDDATVRIVLYKPKKLTPNRKYPVLVYAYGMPGSPAIQDAWPSNRGLFHQFLVQEGFVVALVDDRTSAIPGHKYAVAAHQRVGPVAAKDHEFAVQYLKSLPYVNGAAIGIWGWSGGGFTAAYHVTHTRLFTAGIAGAPVTDWRLYDSVYTERYMGLPAEVPEAYDRASVLRAAPDYKGRLLLIYGGQDDNVHPQNTIQLVQALIRNKKQFDLMEYPDKTHGITGASDNIHLHTMIFDFLKRYLR